MNYHNKWNKPDLERQAPCSNFFISGSVINLFMDIDIKNEIKAGEKLLFWERNSTVMKGGVEGKSKWI